MQFAGFCDVFSRGPAQQHPRSWPDEISHKREAWDAGSPEK